MDANTKDEAKKYLDQINSGSKGLLDYFNSQVELFKSSLIEGGREELEKHMIDPAVLKAAKEAANNAAKSVKDLQKQMRK